MCALLALLDWSFPIPVPVLLSAFAVIGYLFGRKQRELDGTDDAQARRELKRAQHVAGELEKISEAVRKHLASHSTSIARFKDRVYEITGENQESAWKQLCAEAEEMLKPTLRLAAQIAQAYDEIRQQSNNLLTFAEVRTDPLTGVNNRRGLEDALASSFAMLSRYETPFSVLILDLDHFKAINDERGHLHGDKVLKSVANLLNDNVRETDTLSRFGGEEFVIILPHTDLNGSSIFAERLRLKIANQIGVTVSIGVAMASTDDSNDTLLGRADAALYGAKAGGRNCVYVNNGYEIQPADSEVLAKA